MKISKKDWSGYTKLMSRLSLEASDKVESWIAANGLDNRDELIAYVYGVATKYGEGAAELACELYDELAEVEGKVLEPAIPANTARYGETAKAVNGSLLQSPAGKVVPQVASRLVKQAGADTTLQNAQRDGAQFAWIPSGDTCAFCLTLASRGWQKISKKTLKNGHAEHIHANCNCNYVIRFDDKSTVEGYDPNKYLAMYNSAEGRTSKEKLKSLRRELRAAKQDIKGQDVTKRYLQDATPKQGTINYDVGFNKAERPNEVKTAKWLHDNLGGDIKLLKEKNANGVKNPDYLWEDALWDLKNTTTEFSANSAIKKGLQQIKENPGGIILDYGDNEITMDKLIRVIERRMSWYKGIEDSADILIILKGELVKVLRY